MGLLKNTFVVMTAAATIVCGIDAVRAEAPKGVMFDEPVWGGANDHKENRIDYSQTPTIDLASFDHASCDNTGYDAIGCDGLGCDAMGCDGYGACYSSPSLWERIRGFLYSKTIDNQERHRAKRLHWYMHYQSRKKLLHPECAPICHASYGYHQTMWRPFPEQCLYPASLVHSQHSLPMGVGPMNAEPMNVGPSNAGMSNYSFVPEGAMIHPAPPTEAISPPLSEPSVVE